MGRTALVIGGGADGPPRPGEQLPMGNGRAIALRLSQEGAHVAVTDRLLQLASETVRALAGPGFPIEADARDAAGCAEVVRQVIAELGSLNTVICNVGVSGEQSSRVQTIEDWNLTMDINVRSHWLTAQASLEPMLRQGGGTFVFVSSVAAAQSAGSSVAYEASKAALLAVARHFGVQYGRRGIRSNAVLAGAIDSTMARRIRRERGLRDTIRPGESVCPLGRWGMPEEVASCVAFLASDDASYVNASCLVVDGGRSADIRLAKE